MATMHETEGVVQFRYTLVAPAAPTTIPGERLAALNGWRGILAAEGLIGRTPARYGGLGFGNLSVRDGDRAFYISASQTGGVGTLTAEHVVRVSDWDFAAFAVTAAGSAPPSSEALTHAMIYAADGQCTCVLHVHSPAIWRHAARLALPATDAAARYGSPAMAASVSALLGRFPTRPLLFVTPGHEDGVFVAGAGLDATGNALLAVLRRAHQDANDAGIVDTQETMSPEAARNVDTLQEPGQPRNRDPQ
jgi:hypothetical protein